MFAMTEPEPKGRMWFLMDKAKKDGLTEEEKQDLQRQFLRVAVQDLMALDDQGLLRTDQTSDV
jgi:hypothetical protein